MHMNIAGKEIMAKRIAEHIREAFSKRKSSTITLQWKQDVVKTSASTGKYDTETRMDETVDNKQENVLLLTGNDDENSNYNSDNSNCDNGDNLKDTIILNPVTGCSDNKGILPKRDRKCLKAKNDFLWF
jgi:hypothetical protein